VGQRIVVADAEGGALHKGGGGEQIDASPEVERHDAIGVQA
jgi:hypothetical protein